MMRSASLYNKNAIEIISSIKKVPVGFEPAGAFFFSQTKLKEKDRYSFIL